MTLLFSASTSAAFPGESSGHPKDIAQVAAVGKGELWVVDTGIDLAPGDLLISSHVPGCVMRDDTDRFPVGHIVARATDTVRWSFVAPAPDGARRARISVLFDPFTRPRTLPRSAL